LEVMKELRFDGRAVIVTGAGRGVGRNHALLLAARGARVVVADLGGELDGRGSSSDPADQVVKEIESAGGEAVACYASVAEEAGAAAIVQTALDAFGRLDAVINNAGISDPGLFETLPTEQFRRMLDVHYLGTVSVLKAAWPHLRASGDGRVVNTCSEALAGIHGKVTSYGAAKGAVLALTLCLAAESRKDGILVNAVAPRAATRLSAPSVLGDVFEVSEEEAQAMIAPFAPELVSPVAAYLAHQDCQLNGAVLVAGGGQVQRMAIMENAGISRDGLTPEDIATNLDTVTDMTSAQVLAWL
jgi:NAD(P)-dependent dehydrogenase (short-subunit alcohol dehydrogenase family)